MGLSLSESKRELFFFFFSFLLDSCLSPLSQLRERERSFFARLLLINRSASVDKRFVKRKLFCPPSSLLRTIFFFFFLQLLISSASSRTRRKSRESSFSYLQTRIFSSSLVCPPFLFYLVVSVAHLCAVLGSEICQCSFLRCVCACDVITSCVFSYLFFCFQSGCINKKSETFFCFLFFLLRRRSSTGNGRRERARADVQRRRRRCQRGRRRGGRGGGRRGRGCH